MNIYRLEKLRAIYEETRMKYFSDPTHEATWPDLSNIACYEYARDLYFAALDELSDKEEGSK